MTTIEEKIVGTFEHQAHDRIFSVIDRTGHIRDASGNIQTPLIWINRSTNESSNSVDYNSAKITPIEIAFQAILSLPTETLSQIIDNFMREMFRKSKKKLLAVFFTKKSTDHLYYSIFLKNDTIENRQIFFDVVDEYNYTTLSSKIKVSVRFIPKELITNYKNGNPIA